MRGFNLRANHKSLTIVCSNCTLEWDEPDLATLARVAGYHGWERTHHAYLCPRCAITTSRSAGAASYLLLNSRY